MPFHAIAMLSGGRQKTLPNKTEDEMMSQVVMPFESSGVVTAKWGSKVQSYQVLELRIFQTKEVWDKRSGPLSDMTKGKRNLAPKFRAEAQKLLAKDKPRVFMVTPIQGTKHGDMEQQRILREYDERFATVEKVVERHGGVAIRIDREQPLEDIVTRIKREIRAAAFLVADLTDERQSCYFEAGFGEALGKRVIYVASPNSVMAPGTPTRIHFDIHMGVQFFTNHRELEEKLDGVIEKNKAVLFPNDVAEVALVMN